MRVGLLYGRNVFQTGVKRYAEELEHGLRAAGDDVTRIEIARRELKLGRWRAGGFLSFWLARLTAAPGRHDVLHALDPAVVVRGTDVVTVHDLTQEIYPEWYQRHRAARWDIAVTRAIAHRVPWVIADSDVTRSEVISRWGVKPERIVTVRLGVDQSKFRPTAEGSPLLAKEKPNLVYTGDDNPRKNLMLAVRAVAKLRESEGIDARLIRLGPSRHPEVHGPYREFAAKHRVDLVEPGFVDEKELVGVLSHADAFLWPPLAEGFGFPPLEAMSCGLPVVALDTPINREICGAVSEYHPGDPTAMASAVERMLREPPQRDRILAHARTFTWERTVRETQAVYARVRDARVDLR
ncbi:MAG: glycosyltransferase family 1 protein [Candidatus Thermoplasmatota archaeon]